MSNYLIEHIAALLNVILHVDKHNPTGVTWPSRDTGETSTCNKHFLFLFIGADPSSA
jgi:hypothetical protein